LSLTKIVLYSVPTTQKPTVILEHAVIANFLTDYFETFRSTGTKTKATRQERRAELYSACSLFHYRLASDLLANQ